MMPGTRRAPHGDDLARGPALLAAGKARLRGRVLAARSRRAKSWRAKSWRAGALALLLGGSLALVIVVGPGGLGPAFARQDGGAQEQQAGEGSFARYLETVAARARAQGVSEATIHQVLAGLSPSERVIALDRANLSSAPAGAGSGSGGFASMAAYLARHNTPARVAGGVRKLAAIGPLADQVEHEYGVPAAMLVAIWGHETAYGAVMGGFDLPRALATLAWDGRRRELFEPELIGVLKMVDQGVDRAQLVGSWAGAFGNPQFLPTVYLAIARDGDGDGRRDIWGSDADTLHSIAHYFRKAGWRTGQPWGVRAHVPGNANREGIASRVRAPQCARVHQRLSRWLTVREWRARGIEPRGPIDDDVLAALFEPDGPAAPGYLLTQNYRVILEYNCSNYYAMSVGLLADEISR